MKNSQLMAILNRLAALQATEGDEIQTRRFEKDGDERAVVSFDPQAQTFELEETAGHQKFQFDDIDLVAMEIFDLLND